MIWEVNDRLSWGNVYDMNKRKSSIVKFLSAMSNVHTKCRLETWT